MLVFTSLVVIAFGILQIILFFKLWGMTNDIARIVLIMERREVSESSGPANQVNNSNPKNITQEAFNKMRAAYFQEYTEGYKRQLLEEYKN